MTSSLRWVKASPILPEEKMLAFLLLLLLLLSVLYRVQASQVLPVVKELLMLHRVRAHQMLPVVKVLC